MSNLTDEQRLKVEYLKGYEDCKKQFIRGLEKAIDQANYGMRIGAVERYLEDIKYENK